MSEEITTLELGTFSTMSFKLHPSVPLQMMEFYYRKNSTYMIGALLGHIESTHVSITNCYAIPLLQSEDDDSGEVSQREIIAKGDILSQKWGVLGFIHTVEINIAPQKKIKLRIRLLFG